MAGFEGFEKRLELQFTGDDPMNNIMGLRMLGFESIDRVLEAVQCTVVSAVGNKYFDAYVLSESSLFVYPTKIIIKTCGTTQLLKSIRPLLHYANLLGFYLCGCKYTRGSFIFPQAQPFPHTSFKDEVFYIQNNLPPLCYTKALVMPASSSNNISSSNLSHFAWHVFTASDQPIITDDDDVGLDGYPSSMEGSYTMEVCMTELDQTLARKFFRRPGDNRTSAETAGKEMTKITGINDINSNALICDFAFDPCGYSMNGLDQDKYSTIHVTPEDGFSYASFECVGSVYDDDVVGTLQKVVHIFRPGVMSVAITCSSSGRDFQTSLANGIEPIGFKCRSYGADDFPAIGTVFYQTFTSRRQS